MSLSPLPNNSILSMKDMLCQLCGHVYKEPKMLACLHNFCTGCLVKYIADSTKKDLIICPQCQLETELDGPVREALPLNTLVKRNINEYKLRYGVLPAEPPGVEAENNKKGKYTETCYYVSVEGKENMGTHQTCSVINDPTDAMDGSESQTMTSDEGWTLVNYNSTIDRLHEKYLQLQTKALQITYAVESVNQSVEDWRENRCRVKEDIQHRSQCLQSLIRQLERKLIAEMESSKNMDEFMQEVTDTKAKLQDTLKITLHNIQFIRQLINGGQKDDIVSLGKAALQISPHEIYPEINLRLPEYKLECINDRNSNLANEFGELEKSWREKIIMTSGANNVDVSQQKTVLSDNPADLTRSMIADPSEVYRTKHHHKVRIPSSSPSTKRNSNRHSVGDLGGKHLMVLTDAEKNVYLKYEEAKKNLEKRRRELAVKHMVGHKSRSQDENILEMRDENVAKTSSTSTSINRNRSLSRGSIENKLKKVKEIYAGSESDISSLNDNWRRSRHDSYREDIGEVHSETSSPITAAKVSMARKKVTAILKQPSSRSNSLSPQLSEASFFGGASNPSTASSDKSPTTPEKTFMNDRWQDVFTHEQKMEEDKEEEDENLSETNNENEQFKPMTRDKFNQVKENVRRKSDRWRSVSTTN